MPPVDCLIIGQGIAGSLLAWELQKLGQSVRVVDELRPNSASMIAAGIMNPVIGKRFSADEQSTRFLHQAKESYAQLQEEFGQEYFHRSPIRRIFETVQDRERFEARLPSLNKLGLCQEIDPPGTCGTPIKDPHGSALVSEGGFCQMLDLLSTLRFHFSNHNLLSEEAFHPPDLQVSATHIGWKDYHAGHIVFCEGMATRQNPYLQSIPLDSYKGEILQIRSPLDLSPHQHILNCGTWLVPTTNQAYYAGSTYEPGETDAHPSEQGQNAILNGLRRFTDAPLSVSSQFAGLRPVTPDRLPVVGPIPGQERLHVFNGLGSRGATWAPVLAQALARQIVEATPQDLLAPFAPGRFV